MMSDGGDIAAVQAAKELRALQKEIVTTGRKSVTVSFQSG
jgi:hypothetical protein